MNNLITVRAGYYGNIKEYTFPEASQVIELSDKIRGELGIKENIELVFQKRACPMSAYPSGFSPLVDGSTYIIDGWKDEHGCKRRLEVNKTLLFWKQIIPMHDH